MKRRLTKQQLALMEEVAGITSDEVMACGTTDGDTILIDTDTDCWRAIDAKWKTRETRKAEERRQRGEAQRVADTGTDKIERHLAGVKVTASSKPATRKKGCGCSRTSRKP